MKLAGRIGGALGIALIVIMALRGDVRAIFALLVSAGWLLIWLVPLHALPLLLDVRGWRVLVVEPVPLRELVIIAAIREAINRLLPVANVGGELVAVRMLSKVGVAASSATASIVVELLMMMIAQCVFVLLGLACLLRSAVPAGFESAILVCISLMAPALLTLWALLRQGTLFGRLGRVIGRFMRSQAGSLIQGSLAIDGRLRVLLSSRSTLLRACAWQLAGLLAGCLETLLALRFLNHPINFAGAVALESLSQAARSLFFVIPAGLGVQEGTLVGVGRILLVDADAALALSLAKRLRELLFGLPSLAVWIWRDWRSPLPAYKANS